MNISMYLYKLLLHFKSLNLGQSHLYSHGVQDMYLSLHIVLTNDIYQYISVLAQIKVRQYAPE